MRGGGGGGGGTKEGTQTHKQAQTSRPKSTLAVDMHPSTERERESQSVSESSGPTNSVCGPHDICLAFCLSRVCVGECV